MSSGRVTCQPPALGIDPVQATNIWAMLIEADHSFIPPLSARSSTTQSVLDSSGADSPTGPRAYFHALQDQHFILAHTENQQHTLAGFMSFRPAYTLPIDDTQTRYNHVTTVLVRPEARGFGITSSMYDTLFAYAKTTPHGISTRTWSTNIAHITLLEKLGLHLSHRLIDDRGDGIDTIYFVKDA